MSIRLAHRKQRGLTLLELVVVIAISMVVAAMAIPSIVGAVNALRLRSTASDMAGLIQNCRMTSVAANKSYQVRTCTTTGGAPCIFVDLNGNGTLDAATENKNLLVLPTGMNFVVSGAPSLTTMSLGYTPTVSLPGFTSRGVLCTLSGSACTTPGTGVIYYIQQSRSLGGPGWAAVSITVAGRIKAYTWNSNNSTWQ